MDKPKTSKEKMRDNPVRHRQKKERQGPAPLEDDLEQIRRELGWGLIRHKKDDTKRK